MRNAVKSCRQTGSPTKTIKDAAAWKDAETMLCKDYIPGDRPGKDPA